VPAAATAAASVAMTTGLLMITSLGRCHDNRRIFSEFAAVFLVLASAARSSADESSTESTTKTAIAFRYVLQFHGSTVHCVSTKFTLFIFL